MSEHHHEHDHAHKHDHSCTDSSHHHNHGHSHSSNDSSLAAVPSPDYSHSHDHGHGHGHAHEHLDSPGKFEERSPSKKRRYNARGFVVGVGGPVGSGKTAFMLAACLKLRTKYNLCAVTNDIFTREDGEFLVKHAALSEDRIMAVETGGCPHAAIREGEQQPSQYYIHIHLIFCNAYMRTDLLNTTSHECFLLTQPLLSSLTQRRTTHLSSQQHSIVTAMNTSCITDITANMMACEELTEKHHCDLILLGTSHTQTYIHVHSQSQSHSNNTHILEQLLQYCSFSSSIISCIAPFHYYFLSIHLFNTPSLSTHLFITPCQHTFLTHLFNTPYQHTFSTHLFNTTEHHKTESGGDNLAADFSRELADFTVYVIDLRSYIIDLRSS